MRVRFILALCGLIALGICAPLVTATAQTAGPAQAPIAVSDAKLQAFVAAALKVGGLIDEWTPKIEAAATADEKTKLKQTANAELVAAIQSNGDLTLPEYRQISQAAETDPALQQRIMALLEKSQE